MSDERTAQKAWPKPAAIGFGLAVILGLIAVNAAVFAYVFDLDFLHWYVTGSALIGVLTSVAMNLWGEAESNVDLIDAHPLVYLRACCMLAGAPLFAAGTILRSRPGSSRNAGDVHIATLLLTAVGVALVVWILVIVPPQYFVYLVCGAPARLARDALTVTAYIEAPGGAVTIAEVPRGAMPEGAKNVDLFAKPVPATALISSGIMFLVQAFVL